MNPARTLAERFRTLRTDRIRVDGTEVLSVLEVRITEATLVEVFVESHRSDVDQLLVVGTRGSELRVGGSDLVQRLTIPARLESAIDFMVIPEGTSTVRVWNAWRLDDADHAWTGNAGMVVEELDVPAGASRRLRLWCSDGLGNPEFGDLVVVITVAPASESNHGRPGGDPAPG